MIKQEANNSFAEGLMMDMNPLITPNTVMTNCLNGTLVTFNGNEYMLQNDMGNGRVETAFLPEGYIPMGTCELGGIIYIVSYNPLQGTCQVGSFPSPERNITSDEKQSATTVLLTNDDFQWEDPVNGAGVYYLKKDLDSTLRFYPGDKFIVYSSDVQSNSNKLNGLATDKKCETLRLSLGTVTSDGKLVVFDTESLKKFKVGTGEYHIKEHVGGSSNKVDLDDYRDLVSQPYNIFNSKVSGTLVLIAELVLFDSFSANISHHFTEDSPKSYLPLLQLEFSGSYEYVPYGVQKKFTLIDSNGNIVDGLQSDIKLDELEPGTKHEIKSLSLLEGTDILSKLSGYFDKPEREKYTLNYELVPCMIWGPVKHLSVKGSIALDKIGSGFIDLVTWKYYNSDSKCNLTWGLETYEEENKKVKDVTLTFSRLVTPDVPPVRITYNMNKKNSYHGTFYELIPFDKPYYKLEDANGNVAQLDSNTLYLVDIAVNYSEIESAGAEVTSEPKHFYRWLYTNTVFNDYFYSEADYKVLPLNMFKTTLDLSYEVKSTTSSKSYHGFIRGEKLETAETISPRKALCAIQTYNENNANCKLKVSLTKDYGTFRVKTESDSLVVSLKGSSEPTMDVDSKIKYIDREDSEMDTVLRNEILQNWDGIEKTLPANATSPDTTSEEKFIGDSETIPEFGNGLKVITLNVALNYNNSSDSFGFGLKYNTIAIAKAYATMNSTNCASKGKILPLAYDNDTFADYNLEYRSGSWRPVKFGTFGFREDGGRKGKCWVGYMNDSVDTNFNFCEANDVDFNWTGDANIIAKELSAGWNSVLMFAAHHCATGNNPEQTFYNKQVINATTSNGFSASDSNMSRDSRVTTSNNIVIALMKSNVDDYYYPLNCARRAKATNGYTSYMGNNWSAFYKHIATVLNNLFRYSGEVTIKTYFLPQYIYYGDDYTYNVNIPLQVSLKPGHEGSIQLVLENNTYINIDLSLINKFITNISDEQKEDLIPNITTTITDTIKDEPQSIHIVSKDTTSGITLRNLLLDQQISDLGIIVCGYDGKDSGVSVNGAFDERLIYCLNNGVPELATNFKPILLTYSGGIEDSLQLELEVTPTTLSLYSKTKSYNISKNYVLNDAGLMIAKDPPKSELNVKRNGDHDTGTVYGYIKRGLSPDYEFWK